MNTPTKDSTENETEETKLFNAAVKHVQKYFRNYSQKHSQAFDFEELTNSLENCDRSRSHLMRIKEVSHCIYKALLQVSVIGPFLLGTNPSNIPLTLYIDLTLSVIAIGLLLIDIKEVSHCIYIALLQVSVTGPFLLGTNSSNI